MEINFGNGVSTLNPIRITQTVGTELILHVFSEPMWHDIEIWRATVDDQAQASLVIRTPLRRFSDTKLIAGQSYWYWYRFARTMSTGEVHYGNWVSKQGATPLIPLAPIPADLSISTIKIEPDAITGRMVSEENIVEWVQAGTDENDNLVPGSDSTWDLTPLIWSADGSFQIISVNLQMWQMPVYFRMPGAVTAQIECAIYDLGAPTGVDGNGKSTYDPNAEELVALHAGTVGSIHANTMPINPSQFFTTGISRDYRREFFLQTIAGHDYAIKMNMLAAVDDNANYIFWGCNLRQVSWQLFRR